MGAGPEAGVCVVFTAMWLLYLFIEDETVMWY